ncbi:MAG TPA: zinc ribbon domain-containing protein [Tepidisphaeraceae bacterium]|nr:zinc ribbon domain-containing protein [Tepidisphaeraceae bacterium]
MTPPAPQASPHTSAPPGIELFCPACGYSLRGIDSELCPECGFKVDRSAAAVSRIPWEHRRRLGWARAYWRTMWMSTRVVAGDVVRPVNYRDARRFQLITVLIASFPLAALAALPLPANLFAAIGGTLSGWPIVVPPGWAIDLGLPLLAGVGVGALPVAIVLYLLATSGVASYFFHPPHLSVVQQNRAIALSYYACAPLVLLILPALIAWVYLGLHVYRPGWENRVFLIDATMNLLMAILPVVTVLMMWFASLGMLRHATACSTARLFAMAIVLPVAWVVLAGLILVALPWVVGFAMIVVWSLQ